MYIVISLGTVYGPTGIFSAWHLLDLDISHDLHSMH